MIFYTVYYSLNDVSSLSLQKLNRCLKQGDAGGIHLSGSHRSAVNHVITNKARTGQWSLSHLTPTPFAEIINGNFWKKPNIVFEYSILYQIQRQSIHHLPICKLCMKKKNNCSSRTKIILQSLHYQMLLILDIMGR